MASTRDFIVRIARRTRGALQHAPVLGTVFGITSLLDPRRDSPDAESWPLFNEGTIVSTCEQAVPTGLTYQSAEKLIWRLRDVTFWPDFGGVVDQRGRLIEESIFAPPRRGYFERNGFFRRYPIINCDTVFTTIATGSPWDNHYHWLIDSLPRCHALHDPRVAALGKIRLFACPASPDRTRLLRALLPPYVEFVEVSQHSRVRGRQFLLLPFLAGESVGYLPAPYIELFRRSAFEAFGIQPPRLPAGRLLISRGVAAKRRFANQPQLEEALRPLGFQTVQLENHPLGEQMALFAGAEAIVAPHGAGLTNLIFAGKCNVLEIFAGRPLPHYRWLATAMGQQYANIVGPGNEKNVDFAAPIGQILERLSAMGIR